VFRVPSLVDYDTSLPPIPPVTDDSSIDVHIAEWLHGVPNELTFLVVKISLQ
jgi:hypothetical protein